MSSGGQWDHHPLIVNIVLSVWYHSYIVQFESLWQEDWLGQVRFGRLHVLDLFEIQRLLDQCQAFEAEGDTSQQSYRWERV